MWMDIGILVIVFGSTVLGYIQGFMRTFLHTVGWLLAIVLGFAWYPSVVGFLKDKTGIYDTMFSGISEKVSEAGASALDGASGGLGGIPDMFSQALQAATDAVADSLAGNVTSLLFNLAGFLLIIAAIKLIFWLLLALFSKRNNSGLTGWFDGIFGAIFGGIKGIVIVFILLAVLVPITGLSQSPFFLEALEASRIAEALYNHNTLLSYLKDFL